MAHHSDHDGKSVTSSAVDVKHYPPVSTKKPSTSDSTPPTPEEIRERAYLLWVEQGSPDGCAEQHWLAAERELQDASLAHKLVQVNHDKSGSVQS